jgi:hypothetical protein
MAEVILTLAILFSFSELSYWVISDFSFPFSFSFPNFYFKNIKPRLDFLIIIFVEDLVICDHFDQKKEDKEEKRGILFFYLEL